MLPFSKLYFIKVFLLFFICIFNISVPSWPETPLSHLTQFEGTLCLLPSRWRVNACEIWIWSYIIGKFCHSYKIRTGFSISLKCFITSHQNKIFRIQLIKIQLFWSNISNNEFSLILFFFSLKRFQQRELCPKSWQQ